VPDRLGGCRMTGSQLHFGDSPLLPSATVAQAWPAYSRARWPRYLAAYRQRVSEVYTDLADQRPASFMLLQPLELLVVVTLVGEWVFVRPAAEDTITLTERWEHPDLANWDLTRRPDHEQLVRQAVALEADFHLFQVERYSIGSTPSTAGLNPEYFAREQADRHAADALREPVLEKLVDALTGRTIDETALTSLRGRLEEIRSLEGRVRGTRFEIWIGDLLAAHGCQVEPGSVRDGEQIDFFVHKPFRAVMECRWKKPRLQPRELADLTAKLGRRPAIVAGIYVAMSGFTDACRRHAATEPSGRTVLLWDSGDVERLLSGCDHALDLFEEHVSDRVRRYQLDPPPQGSRRSQQQNPMKRGLPAPPRTR